MVGANTLEAASLQKAGGSSPAFCICSLLGLEAQQPSNHPTKGVKPVACSLFRDVPLRLTEDLSIVGFNPPIELAVPASEEFGHIPSFKLSSRSALPNVLLLTDIKKVGVLEAKELDQIKDYLRMHFGL